MKIPLSSYNEELLLYGGQDRVNANTYMYVTKSIYKSLLCVCQQDVIIFKKAISNNIYVLIPFFSHFNYQYFFIFLFPLFILDIYMY